jgi:steroid 5-alpha reductase family enzyme
VPALDGGPLSDTLVAMDIVVVVLGIAAAISLFTWVASLITRDYSWVDRIWSIVPVVYVAAFWVASGFADPRLAIMTVLVALWGARLTFNFARKGGYNGVEDYRWPILRERMTPGQFQVFNVLFIVIFQNALLLLISLPALVAFQNQATPVGPIDLVLAAVFLAFLIGEFVADQQQWDFQRAKAAAVEAGQEPDERFVTTGLWRYSRHPNFFFEQAQWWVFFGFGAVALGSLVHWTLVGPVLLTALFVGSTVFTESITLGRYPEYAQYQRRTSMLIPWIPRQSRAAAADATAG